MNGSRSQRALLMEIMVAVLFFGLCATALMRTFATAHEYSRWAGVENSAILQAQDLAEQLCAAEDAAAVLEKEGLTQEGEAWEMDCGEYRIHVALGEENTSAGTLKTASVRVLRAEEIVVELPCARYEAGEAGQ